MSNGVSDLINKVLEKYGKDILLDSRKFCSIISDLMPQKQIELKVLRRMGDSGIFKAIYDSLYLGETVTSVKIDRILAENGFSDEWKNIALSMFGIDNNLHENSITSYFNNNDVATNHSLIETNCGNLLYITEPIINKKAFAGRNDIQILVLGKGVKFVKKGAFKDCCKLKYLFLPDTIKSFSSDAFAGCENLTYIYEKRQSGYAEMRNIVIDDNAFKDCQNIRIVVASTEVVKWYFKSRCWRTDVLSNCNVLKAVERRVGEFEGKYFAEATQIVFDIQKAFDKSHVR